jgi:oxygen-independent coproporphyrinogen-3 oxidase
MFGLPNQSTNDALFDLNAALSFEPQHLSWYQLTIEPETPFERQTLLLPSDEIIFEIEREGQRLLRKNNFHRYETSAFVNQSDCVDFRCRHNLNYWGFGDYIGLGLAAHGKLTDFNQQKISRFCFGRNLNSYLKSEDPKKKMISTHELPLEFMMNALRLTDGFSMDLFSERTGLSLDVIENSLNKAIKIGYFTITPEHKLIPTELGKNFLNRCLTECFMN